MLRSGLTIAMPWLRLRSKKRKSHIANVDGPRLQPNNPPSMCSVVPYVQERIYHNLAIAPVCNTTDSTCVDEFSNN